MEAHFNSLQQRIKREYNWRDGRLLETRHERIKRIRRWRNIPIVYPDRIKFNDNEKDRSFTNRSLVWNNCIDSVQLMVLSANMIRPTWNWNKTELLPIEQWNYLLQYNGYCRFMSKPVIEPGYGGILSYVPVHGGITYCRHQKWVSTYGFDTAHSGDEENSLVRNLEWVEFQCHLMAKAIRIASRFEPAYLRFKDPICRIDILQRYHDAIEKSTGQKFQLCNNFSAMINVLSRNI